MQRLDALASSAAAAGTETAAVAGAALLRRLQDDVPAVVLAVLGADSLLRLPPAAVFDGLAACFDRAVAQVRVERVPAGEVGWLSRGCAPVHTPQLGHS